MCVCVFMFVCECVSILFEKTLIYLYVIFQGEESLYLTRENTHLDTHIHAFI